MSTATVNYRCLAGYSAKRWALRRRGCALEMDSSRSPHGVWWDEEFGWGHALPAVVHSRMTGESRSSHVMAEFPSRADKEAWLASPLGKEWLRLHARSTVGYADYDSSGDPVDPDLLLRASPW